MAYLVSTPYGFAALATNHSGYVALATPHVALATPTPYQQARTVFNQRQTRVNQLKAQESSFLASLAAGYPVSFQLAQVQLELQQARLERDNAQAYKNSLDPRRSTPSTSTSATTGHRAAARSSTSGVIVSPAFIPGAGGFYYC